MHSPPSLHPPPSIHRISHIPRWCRRLRGPLASEFLPPAGHACPEWHIFGPTPRIQPSPDSSLSLVCVCLRVCVHAHARVCQRERGLVNAAWVPQQMLERQYGTDWWWHRIAQNNKKKHKDILHKMIIRQRDDAPASWDICYSHNLPQKSSCHVSALRKLWKSLPARDKLIGFCWCVLLFLDNLCQLRLVYPIFLACSWKNYFKMRLSDSAPAFLAREVSLQFTWSQYILVFKGQWKVLSVVIMIQYVTS